MEESVPNIEKPLHVLMIDLDENIFHQEFGDSLDRHRLYARSIGRLSMIVYAPCFSGSPARRVDSHLSIIPARARSRLGFLFSAYKIGLELSQEEMPDLITTQDPFGTGLIGFLLKRKLKIPLEVQNHSCFLDNHYWISQKPVLFSIFNRLGKWIIRRADLLRVVNKVEAEKYRRLGIPSDRIKVLPVPANLQSRKIPETALKEFDRRWNIREGEKIILWVGRAVRVKRVPVLLQAVKLLVGEGRNIRCFIVGDGRELPFWKIWAKQLGIECRVVFTGMVSHSDIPVYFARCHLSVLPSVIEGLPRVPLEAAFFAKPVVAARFAGVEEIIVDGVTGLLAELENPRDLARKIADILDDPNKSERMGLAARNMVLEKYDSKKAVESIVSAWKAGMAMNIACSDKT